MEAEWSEDSTTRKAEGGQAEPSATHRPAITILLNLANTRAHSSGMPEEAFANKTGNSPNSSADKPQ